MAGLFLSYSRDDRLIMEIIRDNLCKLGFNLWVDIGNLEPGTPQWERAVKDAVRDIDALIVLCSPSAARSVWVNREINIAKSAGKLIILILWVGQNLSNAIPESMTGSQYVDMRWRSNPKEGFRQLAAKLTEYFALDLPDYQFTTGIKHIPSIQVINAQRHIEGRIVVIGQDVEDSVDVAAQEFENYVHKNRRLEAATPSKTRLGLRSKLKVKISLPDSGGLESELPAITPTGALIRKQDVEFSTFPCRFPVIDKEKGILGPATLCVKVISQDFMAIIGSGNKSSVCDEDQQEIELLPDLDSRTLEFDLIPLKDQRPRTAYISVVLYQNSRMIAQTSVSTELVEELKPLQEIAWNIVSVLLETTATTALATPTGQTLNVSIQGDAHDVVVAGRDIGGRKRASRRPKSQASEQEGQPSRRPMSWISAAGGIGTAVIVGAAGVAAVLGGGLGPAISEKPTATASQTQERITATFPIVEPVEPISSGVSPSPTDQLIVTEEQEVDTTNTPESSIIEVTPLGGSGDAVTEVSIEEDDDFPTPTPRVQSEATEEERVIVEVTPLGGVIEEVTEEYTETEEVAEVEVLSIDIPDDAPNLLVNPGFEGESRPVIFDEIIVFEGWEPFYCDEPYTPEKCAAPCQGSGNPDNLLMGRPEFRSTDIEARVQSGETAQQWSCPWCTCRAGVFQTIETIPGTVCEVGAYVQSWSANGTGFTSDLITQDQRDNSTWFIRIDLAGGLYAFDDDVVVSDGFGYDEGIYDQYVKISYVFVASGERTTVFFENIRLWPIANNENFIDDAYFRCGE